MRLVQCDACIGLGYLLCWKCLGERVFVDMTQEGLIEIECPDCIVGTQVCDDCEGDGSWYEGADDEV